MSQRYIGVVKDRVSKVMVKQAVKRVPGAKIVRWMTTVGMVLLEHDEHDAGAIEAFLATDVFLCVEVEDQIIGGNDD